MRPVSRVLPSRAETSPSRRAEPSQAEPSRAVQPTSRYTPHPTPPLSSSSSFFSSLDQGSLSRSSVSLPPGGRLTAPLSVSLPPLLADPHFLFQPEHYTAVDSNRPHPTAPRPQSRGSVSSLLRHPHSPASSTPLALAAVLYFVYIAWPRAARPHRCDGTASPAGRATPATTATERGART